MRNNYESFDNLETSVRKSSVVQERSALVAVHMYKQFLEFQQATILTNDVFAKMIDDIGQVVDYLRQSFGVRNIPVSNVSYEVDSAKTLAMINILWHTISFVNRYNISPKALPRATRQPLFCNRIFALNGNYHHIVKDIPDYEGQMKALLDNEIASLYIPTEKDQSAIITIRHKDNQEFAVNRIDASREFVLKVIELVCAGGQYHEQVKTKFDF